MQEEIVCKNLMFVQISPSATDLGETLCSLNFASRVRGIETSPACKQADLSELFKYKQMVYIYIYIYILLVFDEISFVSVSFILILIFFLAFFPVSITNNQVEKLKHDEKETKKLQDSLQSCS